jgi:hypothetical protein
MVAFGAALLLGVVLLSRARRENAVRYLGVWLIALAMAGPAAWPWYLSWGLVLLAACPDVQWSRVVLAVSVAGALVVKADGILAFPLHTAPVFVVLYIAVAAALLVRRRRPAVTPNRLRPIAEA